MVQLINARIIASSAGCGEFPTPLFATFTAICVIGSVAINNEIARFHIQHLGSPPSCEHQCQDDSSVTKTYWRVWNHCQDLVHLVTGKTSGWLKVRLVVVVACRRGWTGRYPCE